MYVRNPYGVPQAMLYQLFKEMSLSGLGRPLSNCKRSFKDVLKHVIVDSLNATECLVRGLSHIVLSLLGPSSWMQVVLGDESLLGP